MNYEPKVKALLDWVWNDIRAHAQLTGFSPNVILLPADMQCDMRRAVGQGSAVDLDYKQAPPSPIRVFNREVIWIPGLDRPRVLFERQPVSRN